MNAVPTIQARAVEKIVRAAENRGLSAQLLYRAAGLSDGLPLDADERIPFARVVELYEQAAILTGDDAFGLHVGETVDPKAFDVLGYSVINSPTFGAALERVVRYNSLWTNGSTFAVNVVRGRAKIAYVYQDDSIVEHRHDAEMTFAAIVALGRLITGADWSPINLAFQHQQPADTAEHQRIFRCAMRFGAMTNEFEFDSSTLELPLIKADAGLCAVLDRHAEELLGKHPPGNALVDRVRMLVKESLKGGDVSLERLAQQVGMSGRTLQRKLREQGTSHQEVLDQMRRDLAMRYLREPEMAICEVAYLLGFSESSALHRAFKRWTGQTPKQFRGE